MKSAIRDGRARSHGCRHHAARVVSVLADTPLTEVARVLRDEQVGGVPVE
jgi:CBS domain-containing protein